MRRSEQCPRTVPPPSAKISFFIAGVQKGATTTIFKFLSFHPQIQPPTTKELHFFDNEYEPFWKYPQYRKIYDYYLSIDERLRFDCTPIYCFWPPSFLRIYNYNPRAKIIILFRDPFHRAVSHWRMEYARHQEFLTFAEAIRGGRARLDNLSPTAPEQRVFSYVERGRYGEQVQRAVSIFSTDQMLFLKTEELFANHREVLDQISQFLDIDKFPELPAFHEHKRPQIDWPGEPTLADEILIRDELDEDLHIFSRLSGIHW
jgi:Sulfotransferase domain